MKSRSLRVGRGPKCQSVYLPVQSLNILYPTAALLHGGPDPPWVLLAQPWLPERAAMPPALPQLWRPQNQPSLGSPWQHSVTLRILDFDMDYNPRGLDSVATYLQKAAESQKDARTGQSTFTLSCNSCWPPCPPWTDSPLMPWPCPMPDNEGALTKYLLNWKESIPPPAFRQGSLRDSLSDEGPAIFKDSKVRSLHPLSLKLLPTLSDHFT